MTDYSEDYCSICGGLDCLSSHGSSYEEDYSYEDYDWERDRKAEEEDRFFDRWGYYPDEETPVEAEYRLEREEEERILQELHWQSLEGSTTSLASKIFEAFTSNNEVVTK